MLFSRLRAAVLHGLGFAFYAKQVPDVWPRGLGLWSLLCCGSESCAQVGRSPRAGQQGV